MTDNYNLIGKLAEKYNGYPVVQSLLSLIPFWGSADILLQKRADEIRSDRMRTFFNELAEGKYELTRDLIEQEDFLHRYFSTLRAALNTKNREKIRMFARLLNSSSSETIEASTDEYEELLTILDSITFREFSVLYDLRTHEQKHPKVSVEENDLQRAGHYFDDFKKQLSTKYSIPENTHNAFLARLERTGLYLRFTGTFMDYEGDIGATTPLFTRLLHFVELENDEKTTL